MELPITVLVQSNNWDKISWIGIGSSELTIWLENWTVQLIYFKKFLQHQDPFWKILKTHATIPSSSPVAKPPPSVANPRHPPPPTYCNHPPAANLTTKWNIYLRKTRDWRNLAAAAVCKPPIPGRYLILDCDPGRRLILDCDRFDLLEASMKKPESELLGHHFW